MHCDFAQYKQKGFGQILIIVGIVILVAIAGGVYYLKFQKPAQPISSTFNLQGQKDCEAKTGKKCLYNMCQETMDSGDSKSQNEKKKCIPGWYPYEQSSSTPNSGQTKDDSDESANWKTYTNEELGLSISYITNDNQLYGVLKLLSESNQIKDFGNTKKLRKLSTFVIGYPDTDFSMNFSLYSNPQKLTAQKWWEENSNILYEFVHADSKLTVKETSIESIGQTQSFLVYVVLQNGIGLRTYYISHGDFIMEIVSTFKLEGDNQIITINFFDSVP